MDRSKKIAFSLLGFIGILLLILFVGGFFVQQTIRNGVENELGEKLTWEEVDVNLLRRRISVKKADFSMGSSSIKADAILFKNLNFYNYLFENEFRVGTVEIQRPEIIIGEEQEEDSGPSKNGSSPEQEISIGSVHIIDGTVRVQGEAEAADKLSFDVRELVVEGVRLDSASLQRKVPFDYDSYVLSLHAVQLDLDGLHELIVSRIEAEEGNLRLEQVEIVPGYDKVEFQRQIPYEKDRFELKLAALELNDFQWDFINDSLFVSASLVSIKDADLEVYRNKLLRDDPREKPLYSKKLRNLPVKVDFPKVELSSGRITYLEKTVEERPPGKVYFSEVVADIRNLTNRGMESNDFPVTAIHAEALFNEEAPVELDWEFDVSNVRDELTVSGRLTAVSAKAINTFVKPALNVEVSGGIDSFAFNFSGNDDNAVGDVRTRYRNFKVLILEEDGTEKRTFWSAVANLFIDDDAVTDNVVHNDLTVTRDKTKSFWNFLWLCIREGALSAFL